MKKSIIFAAISLIFLAASANAQTYTFNNDLHLGSNGQDVVNLQTWLMANGYSIPYISSGGGKGYFGSQTQSAVMSYQRVIGLPAYGFFGPMTRNYFNNYNNNNYRGNSLRVTSPNGGETWQRGTTQNITWTGAPGVLNGTADIKLEYPVPACALPGANPRCMIAVRAPITIVSGINLSADSYTWNVGTTQNGVFINNSCDPAPGYPCPVGSQGNSYPVPDGQYKIQICPTNGSQCDDSDNYFNITSSTVSNGQSPVITGIDAPTSLGINQTGTWTVHATDPLNGTLSYAANWGDTATTCVGGGYSCLAPVEAVGFNQVSTFTHSYYTAGTYTVTFTVRNSSNLTAQTSATVVVGGSTNTAGPLKIVSPNGGEVWQRGTTQYITWTSPYYFAATTADLKLIPYQTPCVTQVCPMYALAPYTIATGLQINQNSYSWNVGTAMNYSNVSQTIPDGQYSVQICQSGTSNCDSSDSNFTITSGQTSNLPDINIVSPNGGETWRIGMSNQFTVKITGDPTKVGPFVTAYLVNAANQQTLVYTGNTSAYVGTQTFNASVPTTVLPGSYRLLVNLYQTFPMTASYNFPTAPTPTLQAYDYSDGYFTVTAPYMVNSCNAQGVCI